MRPYNSELDYPILFEAVRSTGKAGGFMNAVKLALNQNGIRFPADFNQPRGSDANLREAADIDRDCLAALGEVCERHGKPIDPESGSGKHRPGYCSICNVGHKTLPAL